MYSLKMGLEPLVRYADRSPNMISGITRRRWGWISLFDIVSAGLARDASSCLPAHLTRLRCRRQLHLFARLPSTTYSLQICLCVW